MTSALAPAAHESESDVCVQQRSAAVALNAMAVSADGLASQEDFAAAIRALEESDPAKATSALAQRIVLIDGELTRLAAIEDGEGLFEGLRAETMRVVTMAHEALADTRAIDMIARSPKQYLTIYLTYGVFPYRPLAHGMARASLAAAVAACDGDWQAPGLPDRIIEYAEELLDKADELAADGRDATRLSDVVSTVHEALPLYAAAKDLLRWARELVKARDQEPDPDTQVELGVTEEYRVACIECVTSVFGTVADQLVSLAFLGSGGDPLHDAVGTAVRQASDRLPFLPSKLRTKWCELADGIPASVTIPYGEASMDLAGRLTRALWDAFDGSFEDHLLVAVARKGRERSASLFLAHAAGVLADWDHEVVASSPDEHRAALRKGQSWLEHDEPERAARAFAAAQRATDGPTRESAAVFLGITQTRMGDKVAAEAAFRAALNAAEPRTELAARLNLGALLGAEGRYAEVESILAVPVFRTGEAGHGRAMAMLAVARGELDDEDGADAAWTEALRSDDEDAVARAAGHLGYRALERDDVAMAERLLRQAAMSGHIGSAPQAAINLAVLARRRGDEAAAAEHLIAALGGDACVVAEAEQRLTEIVAALIERGDGEAAQRILATALQSKVAVEHVDALRAALDRGDMPGSGDSR